MAKASNELTPKQQRFCQEYVIDLNGTQAAIRAGYSPDTANEQSSQLLAKLNIQEYVKTLQDGISKRLEITSDMVVQELAKIGFLDPREMFSVDNDLLNIRQMGDKQAAAISSIEIESITVGRGKDVEEIGKTKKIKFWDKVSALEKLGKHLGIFEKDNSQQATKISVKLNK